MTQKEALEILKTGENVFLTGAAGSGKTFLLNKYIQYLKRKKVRVAITASTGIAATHIGGITIHSFCGMGIKKNLSKAELKTVLNRKYMQNRMEKTKVLIIDEISMLDADRLDLVNSICQAFKQSILPFGGLQVIFCGDFFQLPPVNKSGEKNNYAFNSYIWNNSELKVCYLEEQHRHEDQEFAKILNKIRNSQLDKETIEKLQDRIAKPVRGNVTPTRLYTTNIDVKGINEQELINIQAEARVYEMEYHFESGRENLLDFLEKNCLAEKELVLKIGAVVMFIKNKFDENGVAHYVNGTLGRVTGFTAIDDLPIIETADGREVVAQRREWTVEENDEVVAGVSQIPLRLAWAITVHKSQGMSLDEVVIDLRKSFDYGMGYVALSRVRSLEGMSLLGLNQMALEVSPEIRDQDKKFLKESKKNQAKLNKEDKKAIKEKQKAFLLSLLADDDSNLFKKIFK